MKQENSTYVTLLNDVFRVRYRIPPEYIPVYVPYDLFDISFGDFEFSARVT